MDGLRFRQSLHDVRLNEKSLEKTHADMTARALEAEKSGDHALAVHWAGEAQKLKKYLMMSGNMKDTAAAAHAIQQTNTAMKDLLTAASSLTDELRAADPCALQMEAANLQSTAQIMLEQGSQLLDALPDEQAGADSEQGEAYLRQLMHSAGQEKRARMLQDASKKLDQLQKKRSAETPR